MTADDDAERSDEDGAAVMATFGKRTGKDGASRTLTEPADPEATELPAASEPDSEEVDELEGPFDIDDFEDPAVAVLARLDLGSVLIPLPEGSQLQVELTDVGVPNAVWVVTANGRFTITAYAAPKTGGLWREVAGELADSLRNDSAKVTVKDGPWGREVVGTNTGVVRFIGVDGYRWMIRCVVNGPLETIDVLSEEARAALADTVVRRGDTPLPVRTPLPVQLPEQMAEQLREAAVAQQSAQHADARQQSRELAPRRGAAGSAMQQLHNTTGG
ncbi:hypothetical protein JK2ML_1029 [Mycobacterium leprae Kyoto-2]|uniref:DUF3710 domain-containing protein n=4 Tax=Mycobacterium leprae TaxID=1769 RepID=Q7AQA7_MYCLE|nr:u1764k [Mycobacterium leprae]AWV47726.1 DUF3710 domain-containing protein [Mycobacterium leprae]BBC16925.1 hypothetical protein JK2ML_1029 [Mycobacterium leprae Kyoto-2]CAC31410.1 conserved hypothetical protein [Mycobacterium leprae]CAR71124.1 conserved hypothetical protein [Mycobacterium leprae Br4923]